MFLDSGVVEHAQDGGAPVMIRMPARAAVLSLRERHESVRWLEPVRVMSVRVDDRVLDEAARALGRSRAPALVPSSGVHDVRLIALLQALYAEQASGYVAGPLFVDGIEQTLAALLVSGFADDKRALHAPARRLSPARVRRIEEYVREHLNRPLSLAELADCAGYSPSHFALLFHATFGSTPHRYLQRLRIEQAMALLCASRHSILDTALACGFQTQQHFSRVFREVTGTSPAMYRRQHGGSR
ncbi:MAG TPA: AraC family transcriptional regulator [Pararobbsia sp.]|nr:AraC family transcriptional regulator [Pararobbsia sp.]